MSQVFPDLKISSFEAPSTTVFGQEINFSWTVTNAGTGATSAPVWYDAVWLSENDEYEKSNIYLGSVENSGHIMSGSVTVIKTL